MRILAAAVHVEDWCGAPGITFEVAAGICLEHCVSRAAYRVVLHKSPA